MPYEFIALTNLRIVAGSSHTELFALDLSFDEILAAYAGNDSVGPCVHIAVADTIEVVRPFPTLDAARVLANEVAQFLAATRWEDQEPIRPHELGVEAFDTYSSFDYLSIVISREEIEDCDIQRAISILAPLIESTDQADVFFERVELSIDGYAHTTLELFEIPEVRDYVQALDRRFPYWLYFLDKGTNSFDFLWRCMMPPFLTERAMKEDYPRRLGALLEHRWFPAANAVSDFVGMSEESLRGLSERVAQYLRGHRTFDRGSRTRFAGSGDDPRSTAAPRFDDSEVVRPVSLSLITGNGLCRIDDGAEDEGEAWEAEGADTLLELVDIEARQDIINWISHYRVPLVPDVNDASVLRPLFYYSGDTLFAPFVTQPGTQEDETAIEVAPGARLNPDEEWFGLHEQVESLLRGGAEQSHALLLQCPRQAQVVRVERRVVRKREAALFVTARRRVEHEAWRPASHTDDGFSLAAPETSENYEAASRLAVIALRSVGAHPLDVFPTFQRAAGLLPS